MLLFETTNQVTKLLFWEIRKLFAFFVSFVVHPYCNISYCTPVVHCSFVVGEDPHESVCLIFFSLFYSLLLLFFSSSSLHSHSLSSLFVGPQQTKLYNM